MPEVALDDVFAKIQAAGQNKGDEEAQDEAKQTIKTFNKQEETTIKRDIEEAKNDAEAHGADDMNLAFLRLARWVCV